MTLLKKFVALVIGIEILTACGSSEVNYDRYSMLDGIPSSAFNYSYMINVDLYSVLNEGGIVVKTSDVALRPATNHRWADALDSQLKVITASELKKRNIKDNLVVNWAVSKFNGDLNGNVEIAANCVVTLKKKVILNREFTYNSHQAEDGYQGLVKELRKGWIDIAGKLAASL